MVQFNQVKTSSDGLDLITIEKNVISPSRYAKEHVMPTKDEYSLKNILASGQMPREVNVSGMIGNDELVDQMDAFALLKSKEAVSSPSDDSSADINNEPSNN